MFHKPHLGVPEVVLLTNPVRHVAAGLGEDLGVEGQVEGAGRGQVSARVSE